MSNLCEPCSWCGTKSFLLFGFGHQGPCRLVGDSCGGCPFGASSWAFGSKCRKQGFFGFPFQFASDFFSFLSFFDAAARVAFLDCAVEREVVDR